MGMILSCLVGEAVCCAANGICQCCCCAIPWKNSVSTRVMYTFGFLLTTIIAWILAETGQNLSHQAPTKDCDVQCLQYLAVDRISLGNVLYHSFMCIMTIRVKSSSDFRAKFHNGFWPLKTLMWAGSIIGCFFIDAEVFKTYWIASFIFSFIFIIIQAMLLVEFSWDWTANWVDKMNSMEESSGFYKALLLSFTFLFYVSWLVGTILIYSYFTTKDGCGLNTFFVTMNLLIVLFISVSSILPSVQEANSRSGLFQAAILSIYLTYLVGSAIGNQPNTNEFSCSPLPAGEENNALSQAMLIIGIIITMVALGYQAFSAGSSSSSFIEKEEQDDEKEHIKYDYSWFHFIFVMATMYMTAVLTNWASFGGDSAGPFKLNYGFTAMWIKVVTSWLTAFLYIWTLFAPIWFPNRDFS